MYARNRERQRETQRKNRRDRYTEPHGNNEIDKERERVVERKSLKKSHI